MTRAVFAERQNGASIGFVIVNQATNPRLTVDILKGIAAAVQAQLNTEFAAEWGGQSIVRVATGPTNIGANEAPIYLADTLPDVGPGVVGYHALNTATGLPVAYVAVDRASTDFTTGPDALSVVLSHEACETQADPGANRWADTHTAGMLIALEVCDEVEDTTYVGLGGVHLSNFLYQSYFLPGPHGPYDHLGVLRHPGDVTPGGYAITASAPMPADLAPQIAAHMNALQQLPPRALGAAPVALPFLDQTRVAFVGNPPRASALPRKSHPASRTYRRGVRFL